MSEVNMATGRPEAGAHYAGLYNEAQHELAALREELARVKAACSKEFESVQTLDNENTVLKADLAAFREELEKEALRTNDYCLKLTAAEQRLADAERRNADVEKLLTHIRGTLTHLNTPDKASIRTLAAAIDSASSQPTESIEILDPKIIGIVPMPPMEYDEP